MKHRFLRALRKPKFFLPALGLVLLLVALPLASILAEDSVPEVDFSTSYNVDLYEPVTDVNAAPIIMQSATADIYNVSAEEKRPSAIIFDLKLEDDVLNAYAGETKLGAFADLYTANQPKANVGVRIALGDTATAEELAVWAQAQGVGNLWLISNDVEVLKTVTSVVTTVRGIVDLSGDTVRGPANVTHDFDYNNDGTVSSSELTYYEGKLVYETKTFTGGYSALTWAEVYDLVFTFGHRTVLIPESAATKDNLKELQASQVFAIVQTDSPSATEMYDLLVSGANGILTDDYTTGISVLESDIFNADGGNIVLRDSNVIGHRGDMGNLTVYPENTVEAIVAAAQSGATTVEIDIYGSKDWELLLVHSSKMANVAYSYPENFADEGLLSQEEIDENNGISTLTSRLWHGDLEYLVSNENPDIHISRLDQLFEAVDTEYPNLRILIETKASKKYNYGQLNRILEMIDRYNMRSRCIIADNFNLSDGVSAYYVSQGVATNFLNATVHPDTENRIYAFESTHRPINTVWTNGHASTTSTMNSEFMEELKHFGVIVSPSYAATTKVFSEWYAQGVQGGLTNNPHHTDNFISTLIPTFNAATGEMSVTARTLAYGKTAAANAPVAVDDWWIDQGISSGVTEYNLTGYEVIVLDGAENVTVEGNKVLKVKGAASGKATVAVRYLQTLTDSKTCYVYSPSIEIEATVGTPSSQTFLFSDASGITSLDMVTASNYKTLSYTYSSSNIALHPHLANGNNNWWYFLGSSSGLTNHWKPAWDYLRATSSYSNAAYVAIVIDVAEAGDYEMVLDLCNATGYYGKGRMLLLPYSDTNAGKFKANNGVNLPDGIASQAIVDVTYDCAADNVTSGTRQALLGKQTLSADKYILIFLGMGKGAYSTTTNSGSSVYALTLTKDDVAGAALKQAIANATSTTTTKTVQICRDMDVASDLVIPQGVKLDLNSKVNVSGDVTVENGAILNLNNNIAVSGSLTVANGATLDLNGKTVTAADVSGQITDSTGEGGIKTTSGKAPVLNPDSGVLPLYDKTDAVYRPVSSEVVLDEEPIAGVSNPAYKAFIFQIDLDETAYEYIADSDVEVNLYITYGDKTVTCNYNSDESNGKVADWAAAKGGKAFYVDVANIEALSGEEVTFKAIVTAGQVWISDTFTYNVP